MSVDLDTKLAWWGDYAPRTITRLLALLVHRRDEILALARERHIIGHYRYGDKGYLDYDEERLLAETLEELADAVNYTARAMYLADDGR